MAADPAIKDKVLAVWRDELGLTPAQLAGVSRNIERESGWNPSEWGDNQTSRGLYQHHAERLAALQKFAGEEYLDPVAQTRFAIHEMKTSEPKALAALKSAKTDAEAEKAFRVYFERPKGTSAPGDKGGTGGSPMMLAGMGGGSGLGALLAFAPPPRDFTEAAAAPSAPLSAPAGVGGAASAQPAAGVAPPQQQQAPRPPALRRVSRPVPGVPRPPMPNLGGAYRTALNAILARRSANPFA